MCNGTLRALDASVDDYSLEFLVGQVINIKPLPNLAIRMVRLKCKKCDNIFEAGLLRIMSLHVGPYHLLKCPACGRRSWFDFYASVVDPVTWPSQESAQPGESALSEEELEKRRIEESKYERT